MATRASRPKRISRWNVAARVLAAVPANYVLTSLVVACIARALPGSPAEASMAATILSFALFATIVLIAFGVRSVAKLWLWMIATGLIFGCGLWLSIFLKGRL